MPGDCSRRNVEACEDLDRHVRAIDWTDDAIEFGSPERALVGTWMQASRIVEHAMRRLYPQYDQRETMTRWVSIRIWEKITGTAVESNPNAWNWKGLWNPLVGSSFSGWCRDLATSMGKWNGKRVLHSTTLLESDLANDEDDYNPMTDEAASRPIGVGGGGDIFAEHPDLKVFRPVGRARDMMMRWFTDERADLVIRYARDNGMWHPSMTELSDQVAGALMLMPLRRDIAPMLEDMADDLGLPTALKAAYWPTQTSRINKARERDKDFATLLDLVTRERRRLGGLTIEADIWLELGTMATQLATV